MYGPSGRDVNLMSPLQGRSPLVQVKEPYGNLDMVTVNVLKVRTLKNNYFFPLFVILEITFQKKC